MALENIGVRMTNKQYNQKKISDKTWKDGKENESDELSLYDGKQEDAVTTEEIDLEEVKEEKPKNEVKEEETGGFLGFVSDAWENVTDTAAKVGEVVGDTFDAAKEFVGDTAATVSSGVKTAITTVGEVATGAYNKAREYASMAIEWVSKRIDDVQQFISDNPILQKATEAINEVLKRTRATEAAIVLGIVEGVGMLVEAVSDAALIVATGVATIATGIIDIGAYFLFGKDLQLTKNMWDWTMGYVSESWASGLFDIMYEDTGFGHWIAKNAYGFEKVRGISSGIGYTAGMIVLTVATCGAGTAPTIASAVSSTAAQGAVIAGVAGFGQSAEKAWQEGASLGKGLGYATVKGALDAGSYFIGGKMSGVVLGNGTSAVSRLGTSAARIGFDAFDGGLSGITDPAAQMIYKTDGKTTLGEVFEDNGGWSTVLSNALIGAGMSSFGEISDNIKMGKSNKISGDYAKIGTDYSPSYGSSQATSFGVKNKTNPITKIKDYISSKLGFGNKKKNVSTYGNKKRDVSTYLNYLSVMESAKYTEYIDSIRFTSNSEEGLKNLMDYYNGLKNKYQYNNNASKKLFELRSKGGLTVTDIDPLGGGGAYQYFGHVFLDPTTIRNKNYGVFFHETGHFSDWLSNNFTDGINEINEAINKYGVVTQESIDKLLMDGRQQREFILNYLNDPYGGSLEINEITNQHINQILDFDEYTPEEQRQIFNQIYKEVRNERLDHYYRASGLGSIEDIMDAMTGGNFQDAYRTYGHGTKYYSNPNNPKAVSTEIIANVTDLYSDDKMNFLRSYFSDEFVNSLESAYKRITGIDSLVFDYSGKNNIKLLNSISDSQINGTSKQLFEVLEEWTKVGDATIDMNAKLLNIGVDPQIIYQVEPAQVFGLLEDYQRNVNTILQNGKSIMNSKYGNCGYVDRLKKYVENKNSALFTRDYDLRSTIEGLTDEQLLKYINIYN